MNIFSRETHRNRVGDASPRSMRADAINHEVRENVVLTEVASKHDLLDLCNLKKDIPISLSFALTFHQYILR